jgi:hypothetical protein
VAVIDAGIAIGWIQGRHRSLTKLDRLLRAARSAQTEVVISELVRQLRGTRLSTTRY